MRKRNRTTKPVSPVTETPVTDETPVTTSPETAPEAPVTETPVNPSVDTESPVTEPSTAPETAPIAAEADPVAAVATRRIARDALTVAAYRTNFGTDSDRDYAYAVFFYLAGNATGFFTLAEAHAAGSPSPDGKPGKRVNPLYAGSAKATDAGVINRLRKAGYIAPTNPECTRFGFTERGEQIAKNRIAAMRAKAEAASASNG